MAILATLPNHNLFSSLPSPPPSPSSSPSFSPPIPIPKYPPKNPSKPLKTHQKPPQKPLKTPPFTQIPHNNTKYYKPISPNSPTILPSPPNSSDNGTRAVVIGDNGLSYHFPNAPFEFQFSYSETPKAKPIAIREPAFLPFAPPSMPRPWTGKAPLLSKKEKLMKKKKKEKIRLYDYEDNGDENKGEVVKDERSREEIIGEPLSRAEIKALVKPLLADNRQVNLGRDGLTHNMLDLIQSHWKRQEVCKVKCKGVPTLDMDNVCRCLEERTGGKIIHRAGGVVYLFRGRNYNHRTRPRFPLMLWKPAAPVYPKLIQEAPGGLTKEDADELRRKGKNLLAICKLAKNGVYVSLVNEVRQAFEGSELVKVDCRGLDASDYKKIGAKLMELVPCVLLSFDEEQILMWRGHDWKSMYRDSPTMLSTIDACDDSGTEKSDDGSHEPVRLSPRMMSLWERAIESNKALLLDQLNLGPDALLEKVEEFEATVQATEHSYPALVFSGEDRMSNSETDVHVSENDKEFNDWSTEEEDDEFEDYGNDPFEQAESVDPLDSLPVDLIVKRLRGE